MRLLFWGVLALCALYSPFMATSSIASYEQSIVDVKGSGGDGWTRYVPIPPGAERLFTVAPQNGLLPELPIETPFFSYSSVKWYVSPYGFLSPTPVPMCNAFCEERMGSPLRGSYRFARSGNTTEGGDWPLIGLFVADIDTTSLAKGAKIYRYALGSGKDMKVIVDYDNVPVMNCHIGRNNILKGQVEISTDGTIVMRYKKVPTCPGSIGVVLSKTQRYVVRYTQRGKGAFAVRFTPVRDSCEGRTTNNCTESCSWCVVMDMCIGKTQISERCPSILSNSSLNYNDYYNVTVKVEKDVAPGGQVGDHILTTSASSVEVSLDFEFPFFTSHTPNRKTKLLHIVSSGVISLLSNIQDCGPLRNVCRNGNYSYAIMPFVTAQTWANTSAVRLRKQNRSITMIITTRSHDEPYHLYTYQVDLDAEGRITFRYAAPTVAGTEKSLTNLIVFPPPIIGVVRSGVNDNASIIIPPLAVQPGSVVTFVPRGQSNDCGVNGKYENGRCRCSEGFEGNFCEKCSPGRYGPKCQSCPKCMNGGTCDDGMRGSGRCRCTGMFGGEDCGTTCGGPTNCSKCNLHGGYCGCTGCLCTNGSGWSGATCSVFQDPCLKYSLHGCGHCTRQKNDGCAFCADGTCYSTKLEGTPQARACSYRVDGFASQICVGVREFGPRGIDPGYRTFLYLCVGAVAFVTVICLLSHYLLLVPKVVNMHVAGAAGGAPDYIPARREREVVQAGFVSARGKKYVQGVPLKQISLHKLYKEQRGEGLIDKE